MSNLLSAGMGFDSFVSYIKRRFPGGFFSVVSLNQGRHRIYGGRGLPSFYVVFKKDYLRTFNFQFPGFVRDHPEFKGLGESLNVEWLRIARAKKIDWLVFIYPSGDMYVTTPDAMFRFCNKFNLVRSQKRLNDFAQIGGKSLPVSELTYVVPLNFLSNIMDVDLNKLEVE